MVRFPGLLLEISGSNWIEFHPIVMNRIDFLAVFKLKAANSQNISTIRSQSTVVGLSTRPDPLIISKFLQNRIFWSESKAFIMTRCTLRVGSGFKTFRVQKWPFWVQNFGFLQHKITNFLDISGWQWTMPSGLFAKKIFFCSC